MSSSVFKRQHVVMRELPVANPAWLGCECAAFVISVDTTHPYEFHGNGSSRTILRLLLLKTRHVARAQCLERPSRLAHRSNNACACVQCHSIPWRFLFVFFFCNHHGNFSSLSLFALVQVVGISSQAIRFKFWGKVLAILEQYNPILGLSWCPCALFRACSWAPQAVLGPSWAGLSASFRVS
jgi:hypothetical protein